MLDELSCPDHQYLDAKGVWVEDDSILRASGPSWGSGDIAVQGACVRS
jgi:hypothetical protein